MALNILDGQLFNGVTIVMAAAALAAAVLGVLYARSALFPPKRKMRILTQPPVRLLNVYSQAVPEIEVTRLGQVLPDPHAVTLTIENVGRHAISSDQYDQGRPLVFEFGTPIETLLGITSTYRISSIDLSIDGSAILLGPELIRPKQRLDIQILTHGAPKLKNVVSDPLIDTAVEYQPNTYPHEKVQQRRARRLGWVAIAILVAGMVFNGVLLIARSIDPRLQTELIVRADSRQILVVRGQFFEAGPMTVTLVCGSQNFAAASTEVEDARFQVELELPSSLPSGECRATAAEPSREIASVGVQR